MLGVIVCAIGGTIDQNPTALRHMTVIFVHSVGLLLLLNAAGLIKYE